MASSGGVRFNPINGETPRESLISALKVAMTDTQACDVVEALETYLEEGTRGGGPLVCPNLSPDLSSEISKLRAERDSALAFAEEALRKMQQTLETLRRNDDDDTM
jgi:hypothetical protein